jgi:hypothetical protein
MGLDTGGVDRERVLDRHILDILFDCTQHVLFAHPLLAMSETISSR